MPPTSWRRLPESGPQRRSKIDRGANFKIPRSSVFMMNALPCEEDPVVEDQMDREKHRLASGKFIVVTGASSGIGFQIARQLTLNGAHVVIAADHADKGEDAVDAIRSEHPPAMVEFEHLDLSNLSSVHRFADRILARDRALDALINVGGIPGLRERALTDDGFERVFATNYLGHFALTGRLLEILRRRPLSRLLVMGSLMHRDVELMLDDLQLERGYSAEVAYGQSKLALLMFTLELHRRARRQGLSLMSLPVHPGIARTNFYEGGSTPHRFLAFLLGQSPEKAAWSALFAATSGAAKSGVFYGPTSFREIRGAVGPAIVAPHARSRSDAEDLWSLSERWTGVNFGLDPVPRRRAAPAYAHEPIPAL